VTTRLPNGSAASFGSSSFAPLHAENSQLCSVLGMSEWSGSSAQIRITEWFILERHPQILWVQMQKLALS
jgi:hypothetical protein